MVVRMTKRLVIPNACEESRIIAALMGDSSLHAVPFRMTVPFEEKVIMTIMSFRARPLSECEESPPLYRQRFFISLRFIQNDMLVISNVCERSHTKCFTWDEIVLFATATFRMTMFFEKKIVMRIMSFRARTIARRGISAVILNVGEISKFYCSVPNDNCFILNGKEASPLSKYLKRDSSLVGIGMAGT